MQQQLKLAVIGLGNRGSSVLEYTLLNMLNVEIIAVCDEYEDRTQNMAHLIEEKTGKRPYSSTDYMNVLNRDGVEAVYIATSWETHVEIGIDALKKGIPVALEVGGAYSIQSMWDLVRTQEKTGTPLMLMENCCFGKHELLVTSLVRHGLFGEIVHGHGAYGHCLCDEIAGGEINRHYRLRNYLTRNCENYPTHELGPIAKILNINRGNRMVSLVSVASKAVGMEDYIAQHADKYPNLVGKRFLQGDIVNTVITCADGSTISLRLDTTLPRSYSREFTIRGTRGMYEMNNNMVYFAGEAESMDTVKFYREHFGNVSRFEKDYLPKEWNLTDEEKKNGHGGMDAVLFRAFVDAVSENKPMPIDVYDAAAWMSVSAISEASITAGGMPQAIPDFTCGMWTCRTPADVVTLL